jgi:inosine/xanthosine triphosphatase
MKIIVASTNPQKIKAVSDLISQYNFLAEASVEGVNINSGVSDQPKSLEETIQGAINRAKSAFNNADYSFGIESGLMQVLHTKSGIMDVCVCAIFDGKNIHLGLSSAFEPPKKIVDLMHNKGMNMSDACVEIGLTDNPKLGSSEGLIGILTRGRMNRLAYTTQAVMTALIHLENTHLFEVSK